MDMKWTPIVDGDLSGIPRDEYMLFTVLNKSTGEVYTATGMVEDYFIKKYGYIFIAGTNFPIDIKLLKAWAEFPEPYKPTPDKCFKCNHGKLQHDESSDNWFECELLQRDVPPNGKPNDCPLNR